MIFLRYFCLFACVSLDSKKLLNDIETQISQVKDDIPLTPLNDALNFLGDVQGEINKYTPEVEKIEKIRWVSWICRQTRWMQNFGNAQNVSLCQCFSRWAVYLIISCVVLLVVVCNLLGLLLGPMGLKSKADPTRRSCTADCGGIFFMMWVPEVISSNCFPLWALCLTSDPGAVAGVQVSALSSPGCSWLSWWCCSCWAGKLTLWSVGPGTMDNC